MPRVKGAPRNSRVGAASSRDEDDLGYARMAALPVSRATIRHAGTQDAPYASSAKKGGFALKSVAQALIDEGLDPAAEIARILREQVPMRDRLGNVVIDAETGEPVMVPAVDHDTRLKLFDSLLQYTQPKLKAVEVSGPKGGPLVVENRVTDDQAIRMAAAYLAAASDNDDDDEGEGVAQ